MEMRFYNDWGSANMHMIDFSLHNCGDCFGFDLFILGFGFAVRV